MTSFSPHIFNKLFEALEEVCAQLFFRPSKLAVNNLTHYKKSSNELLELVEKVTAKIAK